MVSVHNGPSTATILALKFTKEIVGNKTKRKTQNHTNITLSINPYSILLTGDELFGYHISLNLHPNYPGLIHVPQAFRDSTVSIIALKE